MDIHNQGRSRTKAYKHFPRYSSLSFKAKGKVKANYRSPHVYGNVIHACAIEEDLLDYLKPLRVSKL